MGTKHFWEAHVPKSTELKFYPVTKGKSSYYKQPQGLETISEENEHGILILEVTADESFGVDIIGTQNNCLATVYSSPIEVKE